MHRDKLESSTERERKEGAEQKGEECLQEKENQVRSKPEGKCLKGKHHKRKRKNKKVQR